PRPPPPGPWPARNRTGLGTVGRPWWHERPPGHRRPGPALPYRHGPPPGHRRGPAPHGPRPGPAGALLHAHARGHRRTALARRTHRDRPHRPPRPGAPAPAP